MLHPNIRRTSERQVYHAACKYENRLLNFFELTADVFRSFFSSKSYGLFSRRTTKKIDNAGLRSAGHSENKIAAKKCYLVIVPRVNFFGGGWGSKPEERPLLNWNSQSCFPIHIIYIYIRCIPIHGPLECSSGYRATFIFSPTYFFLVG